MRGPWTAVAVWLLACPGPSPAGQESAPAPLRDAAAWHFSDLRDASGRHESRIAGEAKVGVRLWRGSARKGE